VKGYLAVLCSIGLLFCWLPKLQAQADQTVVNGVMTAPVIFPSGCTYNWTNSNPLIGLAQSGSGNIPAFTALNPGTTPITAAITATLATPGLAYTTDQIGDIVNAIDLSTNSVIATVPVGTLPFDLAITPDDSKIYVTNIGSDNVSVIGTATNTVIATIPVGTAPWNLTIAPDGSRVYVGNYNSGSISVINTASNTVMATFPVEQWPSGMAVSPDGSLLYLASAYYNNVQVINTSSYTLVATIPVGTSPWGITLSPDGSKLYVANQTPGNVSVINTATKTVIATIATGKGSGYLSISPDGSKLYVAVFYGSNDVWVINTATNSVVADINTGTPAGGLALNPAGTLLYVPNLNSVGISVINTVSDVLTTPVSAPVNCGSIALDFSSHTGCGSTPVTFTITVNPSPQITLAANLKGNISACANKTSTAPNIEQFQVVGSYLTDNISIASPANFEISLAPGSGYGGSITLNQTGGNVNNTVVYVRSSAMAPSGSIAGNIALSSAGATSLQVAVSGRVDPETTPFVEIKASSIEICTGAQATFTATTTNGGNAPSYEWLLNGNMTGTNSSSFVSSALADGDVISCILTSNANCAIGNATSNSIAMRVYSQSQPSIGIVASANPICDGTLVTFTAMPTNGGTNPIYQWLLDGNNTGNGNSTFTSSALKNGDIVACAITASTTCTDTVFSNSVMMAVHPLPTIIFNPDTIVIAANGSAQLTPLITGQIVQYQWTPADGLSASGIAEPIASPLTSAMYQLSVVDNNGCVATGKAAVVVNLPLKLPSAFTPNGDGHDDIFRIPPGIYFNLQELDIFDRFGAKVYTTRDIGKGWDGTYNGQPAPMGTYVYLVTGKTLAGKPVILKGTLILIR
jgi:gliding motility-associated-like protein